MLGVTNRTRQSKGEEDEGMRMEMGREAASSSCPSGLLAGQARRDTAACSSATEVVALEEEVDCYYPDPLPTWSQQARRGS